MTRVVNSWKLYLRMARSIVVIYDRNVDLVDDYYSVNQSKDNND